MDQKYVVIDRDGVFYVGEIVRQDAGRNLDGARKTVDKIVTRGSGDWLRPAIEDKVRLMNEAAAKKSVA